MKEIQNISQEIRKAGLYIHIPFCVKKCNYCAFLSFNAETSPRKEYSDALIEEIRIRGESYPDVIIDTIYIGGGTPSVMDVSQLSLILKAVRRHFNVSDDAEITLEANPGTIGRTERVTRTKLTAYRYMGVNRLSMGVQSMNNDRLHFLGRIHTAEDVIRDVRYAREAGFDNINLDLIFSVPGESCEDALSDARAIIDLEPEHISCYSLQMEEGTPFYEKAECGEISEVPDEEDRETYHRICDMLRKAGYEHYEISNFADMKECKTAPGFGATDNAAAGSRFRSVHNSRYWNMSDYIGVGLGASGMIDGTRYRNVTDMNEYLEIFGHKDDKALYPSMAADIPVSEMHVNTPFDNISEAVFTGLRRREGISYHDAVDAYRRCVHPDAEDGCINDGHVATHGTEHIGRGNEHLTDEEAFWKIFSEARAEAQQFAERGFLIIDEEGLRLTEAGVDISNTIMALFV